MRFSLTIAVPLLILAMPLPFACAVTNVVAENGVMDLRHWDFGSRGSVALSGEWAFYWQAFKAPGKIRFDSRGDRLKLPGSWNRFQDKATGGHGYATLALRVNLGHQDVPVSLYIREIMTAFDVYINGERVAQVGKIGTSPEHMTPEFRPVIVDIAPGQPVLDIVLHISNFHHRRGGAWSRILLGPESEIRKEAVFRLASHIFTTGCILIMGLYHLCLYLLRKRYIPPLYLGIFCCLVAFRSLVINEAFLHELFPVISWEWLMKIEYLGFFAGGTFFIIFIHSLFPAEFSSRVLWVLKCLGLFLSVCVLLFPARIYTHMVQPFQALIVASGGYLFLVFFRAINRRREGVRVLIFGFTVLFISVLNEILYVNGIIRTGYTSQIGMVVFIFSHAFLLSLRYTRTYEKGEQQTRALTREIRAKEVLEASLVESHEQFKNSRIALILGLAKLAEYRDTETGSHLERIREYARMIAMGLSETAPYNDEITPDFVDDIFHASILHDIGKIGIRDDILLKPGPLDPREFEIMKTHTVIGGDAIREVAEKAGVQSCLTQAEAIAYSHHERWDGTGYPRGLAGDAIPLSARITAIADVYDALTSERPYKKAFSHQRAVAIITSESGSHFDPDVVAAFVRLSDRISLVRDHIKSADSAVPVTDAEIPVLTGQR